MEFRAELINPRVSRELRRAVLRPGLTAADALPGDDIADAVHIGAFENVFRLASACFIFPDRCPWLDDVPVGTDWHLRQLATHPDYRGQGAASAVVRTAADYVAATGGGRLWCDARRSAAGFYERIGWLRHGPEHLSDIGEPEPVPHVYLWRAIQPAPPVNLD
jgi:GNAT superfamily N-acetyltransferase